MKIDWHPEQITAEIEKLAMDRLEKAGEVIAASARQKVPVGKDRPPYRTRNIKWSARKAGALKNSIRVVRLKGDPKMNIRVYAGSKEVFYARWVEYGSVHNQTPRKPFLRPALNESKSSIVGTMENG
jgi:HK97 gp10 family phage protein